MILSLDEAVDEAARRAVAHVLAELQRPELVNQRTVTSIVGMPSRDYLAHCRSGDWPSFADRRLRYARTADVLEWIAAHPARAAADVRGAEFRRSRSGLRRIG